MSTQTTNAAVRTHATTGGKAAPERPGHFVAGDGAPVVMLHSSLGSKSQWTALAERIAPRFRAIAIDLGGYGDNPLPAPGTPFSLDDEVRLVAAHVDRLVAPHAQVHLVGHSYGALVALRYAYRERDRVASLSLYEPVAFRMLDDDDPALREIDRLAAHVARLAAAGRRHEAAQTFVDFWSGESSYASLPLPVQAALARRVDKVPLDFRAAWAWSTIAADVRAVLAPCLLLSGERSPEAARRIASRLARALPDCRLTRLDAGHMGPLTDGARVNPWIDAFVGRCAAPAVSL